MPTWDSELYLKFEKERTQPSYDLVSRIEIHTPKYIVDVGCGPGNSTAVLKSHWPYAKISAFDNSSEMLDRAIHTDSTIEWFQADVSTWFPEKKYDLIFSNAVFQWIPDHEIILPKLISFLSDNGAFAVQMPAHCDSPLHKLLIKVSRNEKWKDLTSKARNRLKMKTPEFYYDLLAPIVSKIDIWQTEYYHEIESVTSIIEWFRGTGMRPFLEALDNESNKLDFEKELLTNYQKVYKTRVNKKVLLPFRRFFFIAYK